MISEHETTIAISDKIIENDTSNETSNNVKTWLWIVLIEKDDVFEHF